MSHPVRTDVIDVVGRDALEYLQGQVAQDLTGSVGTELVRTALLDPQGTLVAIASLHVEQTDRVVVEVPEGVGPSARTRLERFAIRADVEFEVREVDEARDHVLRDEASRIDAGIPGPRELEAGLVAHALEPVLFAESVSLTKGCYPGQELVARMQSRGATPPYVLRGVVLAVEVDPGTPAGDAGFDGRVTSIVEVGPGRWHALCVLHRRDASAGETIAVHGTSGDVVAVLR